MKAHAIFVIYIIQMDSFVSYYALVMARSTILLTY
jgi:hypothetical protein